MPRVHPDKEATLREVLAEVSLLDLGRMLKQVAMTMGCLGVFYALIFLGGAAASAATGIAWDDLGIPAWALCLAIGWVYIWGATSERSFHELHMSWYFPKLGWLGSLTLSAYLTGFVMLLRPTFAMEAGIERLLTALAVLFGYFGPFMLFLSALNIGHKKLLEKRKTDAGLL